MATAPATAEKMLLDRSAGSATLDLYRAVLGPVRTDYYLKAFTGFDAVGHSGPGWNWAAALLSLNWMLFRQLWAAALAYTGAVTGAALLLFGIGRLLFQLPAEAQWSLALLALLLTVAIPGAYGNAWLYAACNKKMERALRESATTEDACSVLARRAAGRPRMVFFLGGNLALIAAVAAVVMAWPDTAALPLKTRNMEQARDLTGELTASGLAAHSLATASSAPQASSPTTASASAPAPASAGVSSVANAGAAASTTSQPASAVALSRSSQGLVQSMAAPAPAAPASSAAALAAAMPQAPVSVASAAASAPTKAFTPASASAPVPAAAKASASPAPVAAKPLQHAKPAPTPTAAASAAPVDKSSAPAKPSAKDAKKAAALAKKEKAAREKQAAAQAKTRQQEAKATATKPPAASPVPVASAEEKFLINVGLFADPNNARNAYVKLQDAGLPAVSQEVKSSKGPLTRVRVGPFETQTEADAAADKIRGLKLEAAVFKQ